jgi:hypothetical protein
MPSARSMISAITIRPIAQRVGVQKEAEDGQTSFFPKVFFIFWKVSTR